MDELDSLAPHRTATVARPLLGMTILAVEDSKYASEALRQLCLRSGARIRRADCLGSARRHLKVYRPSVAIVDLGLPDGCGTDLIAELDQAAPRVGVILGLSGDTGAGNAARAAGADGFLPKPLTSLAAFQRTVMETLPPDRRPAGARPVEQDSIRPDPLAYRDDMAHVARMLTDHREGPVIDYVTQFLGGVARAAEDGQLARAASDLAECRAQGRPPAAKLASLLGLLNNRLQRRVAI